VHSANRVEELPTVPVSQEPRGRGNLLRAAGIGAVLAIIILGGLNWWKNRTPRSIGSTTPAPAAPRRAIRPQPVVPTPIPPSATGTTGTVVTAGASLPTATTTSGTAPAGLTITAPSAPATVAGTQTTVTTTTQPPNTASAAPAGSAPRLERGKGPITITNEAAAAEAAAAAAAAANDPLRAKYDAMARDAAANPAGTFAVQFELVCETASLTKAIQAGGSNIWFTTMSYRGKPCYRVFWGRYNSQAEAAKAAGEVPRDLRGSATPVVIRIPRS
jgi:septal ring-binding cell division protein DamX